MEETPVKQAFLPNVGQTLARRFFRATRLLAIEED
jgi:hypothetical protein